MYKKLVSISLIMAIMITMVRFTIPYLWYYSNYNYISSELCIHQHNLDHDCEGKCQLKKMVQKTHNHSDQQTAPSVIREQKVNPFFVEDLAISLIPTIHSFRFTTDLVQAESLWTGEPIPPPPQMS